MVLPAGIRRILTAAGMAAMAAGFAAGEENLLKNGGFEEVDGGKPVHWNLFVQPEPAAEGRLDTQTVAEGSYAAWLRNPDTYAKDPCNNWSQNVSPVAAGRSVVAGGRVKTAGSANASIWVQCWRKDPWGVLRVASTGDAMPVQGESDWKSVAVRLTVPPDTDFIVVRCVIRGAGCAWFDDLRLIEAEPAPSETGEKPAPVSVPKPPAERDAVLSDLARETASMAKAIESLRETNETLRQDLIRMREEIEAMRKNIESREPPAPPVKNAPPLVPHEYTEKEPQP